MKSNTVKSKIVIAFYTARLVVSNVYNKSNKKKRTIKCKINVLESTILCAKNNFFITLHH